MQRAQQKQRNMRKGPHKERWLMLLKISAVVALAGAVLWSVPARNRSTLGLAFALLNLIVVVYLFTR
jgi:hypothetical protein